MISYKPLFDTLAERNMVLQKLRNEGVLHSNTIAKLHKDEPVSLQTIVDICVYLDVPHEKVFEIKRN